MGDKIKVIMQNTEERNKETMELFNNIKPLLDEGYGYMSACVKIGRCEKKNTHGSYNRKWFKDLRRYGEEQGYSYYEYSGKGRK